MSAVFDIQKAIFKALNDDVNLKNITKGVFDEVPEKQEFPYITIGEFKEAPKDTLNQRGWLTEATVDIWSQGKGFKEALNIYAEVDRILDGNVLGLGEKFKCVSCYFGAAESSKEYSEQLGVIRRVNIMFEIFVQEV